MSKTNILILKLAMLGFVLGTILSYILGTLLFNISAYIAIPIGMLAGIYSPFIGE